MTATATAIVTHDVQGFLEDHASFEARRRAAADHAADWFKPARQSALASLKSLGLPTTRHEDWRFTNLERVITGSFKTLASEPGAVTEQQLAAFDFFGDSATRLVFVNGKYWPRASHRRPLPVPQGVIITSLAHAMQHHRDLVEPHLAAYADASKEAFIAMSTAFVEDGAFVYVPKGVKLEQPVHLLYVTTQQGAQSATHPRNLIVVENQAHAAVVEDYVSLTEAAYFTNAVTEFVVGEHAVAEHTMIERESRQAINISTLRVQQAASSDFASHSVLLNAALVRNDVHPVLAGSHAHSLINGLYLTDTGQHHDNQMRVEHVRPHCDSRQFYRGILSGTGKAVFTGRIIVHKDAQKTDAKQNNANLLLSDDATVDTQPQLEIYADDVKCTHGATIGQIDEDAVFYLRARGIDAAAARSLLVYAFAEETLDRMKLEPVRNALRKMVLDRLPGGDIIAALTA